MTESFQNRVKKSTENDLKSINNDGATWPQVFAAICVCLTCISIGNLMGFTSSYYYFSPEIPNLNSTNNVENSTSTNFYNEKFILKFLNFNEENSTTDISEELNESFQFEDLILSNETFELNNLTQSEAIWLNGLPSVGGFLGSLFSLCPLQFIGPKRTLVFLASPISLTSWFLISFAPSSTFLYLGHVLGGVGMGFVTSCLPIYIADTASVPLKGALGTLIEIFITLGALTSALLGSFFDWRKLSLFCGILTVPVFLLLSFTPESPLFLITKHRPRQAEESLKKLLGRDVTASEFQALRNHAIDLKGPLSQSKNRRNSSTFWFILPSIKAVLCASILMAFRGFCGVAGVSIYTESIISEILKNHQEIPNPQNSMVNSPQIFLSTFNLVVVCCSALLITKCGRRPLLLFSSIIMFISSLTFSVHFYFFEQIQGYHVLRVYLPFIALIFYNFGFYLGLGPVSWIICAEILTPPLRVWFVPIGVSIFWASSFLVGYTYIDLCLQIQIFLSFSIFAGFCLIGGIFIYFCVPETGGKFDDEIKNFFSSNGGPQKGERWAEEDMDEE